MDGKASTLPHHLDMLLITDPFLIQNCIVQCNSAEFMFGCESLHGLMLYKPAVHLLHGGNVQLDVCMQCHSYLCRAIMPKFALANDLYRGQLPTHFTDLTWVEEMVCAHYRYTAHITCLFQSSDPTAKCSTWKYMCTLLQFPGLSGMGEKVGLLFYKGLF